VTILKVKEGPALTAGLQPGFVVERVNGTLTRFNSQFSIQFQSIKPGDRVIFQVNVGDVVKCMVMLVNSRELDFDSITTLRRIAAGVLLPGDEEIVRDICKVFLAHGGVLNADALQQLTPAEELTKPIKKALGTPRMVKERTARAADSTARGEPASAPAGPSNSNNSNPPPSPAPKPSKIPMPYLQFLGANPFGTARKDSTASLDSETSRRSSSPGKPKPEWNSSPVMPMNRTERIKARAQAKTSISERRPPSPQRAVEVAAHSPANTHKAQSAVKDRPSKPRTTSPVRHIDRLQSPTRNSAGQEKISERLASPRHRLDKLAEMKGSKNKKVSKALAAMKSPLALEEKARENLKKAKETALAEDAKVLARRKSDHAVRRKSEDRVLITPSRAKSGVFQFSAEPSSEDSSKKFARTEPVAEDLAAPTEVLPAKMAKIIKTSALLSTPVTTSEKAKDEKDRDERDKPASRKFWNPQEFNYLLGDSDSDMSDGPLRLPSDHTRRPSGNSTNGTTSLTVKATGQSVSPSRSRRSLSERRPGRPNPAVSSLRPDQTIVSPRRGAHSARRTGADAERENTG